MTREAAASFLDELARRLVPDCDRGAVRAVFETATSGWTGPRGRDGRRASVLTPSGVPFEVNVSGGGGRPVAALRYNAEAAAGQSFFGPRLQAQRTALTELVGWLPGDRDAASAEVRAFVDGAFPEPAAVPARTRFATFVGVVHQPHLPGHIAALKVYANLRRDPAGARRLASTWPRFADLVAWVEWVDGLADLVPQFAALEVGAQGGRRAKLYFRPRHDDPGALDRLARRCVEDSGPLGDRLADLGLEVRRWTDVFVACEARDGCDPALAVYLPAGGSHLGELGAEQVVPDGLWRTVLPETAVDALEAAAATSPGAWHCTWLSVGLGPAGRLEKLNVYCAPLDR